VRHTARIASAGALLLSCAALTIGTASAPATAGPVNPTIAAQNWARVVDARPTGQITGVAAVSEDKVWAFGSTDTDGATHAVAARWNGKKWRDTTVKTPRKGTETFLPTGDAIDKKNVWAAGYYTHESGASKTLVERWNGRKWKRIKSKNHTGSPNSSLNGVAALSPADVWVGGTWLDDGGANHPLVQRLAGKKFTVDDFPEPAGAINSLVTSMTAVAADDVWAAGAWQDGSGLVQGLTAHWDGSAWTIVPGPVPAGNPLSVLWSVSASSATDVWASGYSYSATGIGETYVVHWDGTQWSLAETPNPSAQDNSFLGIHAFAADDVWGVGNYFDPALGYVTFTAHFDGAAWSQVATPTIEGAQAHYLWDIDGVDGAHAYAMGFWVDASFNRSVLGLRWDGSIWSVIE
jgi:hypothetical protein